MISVYTCHEIIDVFVNHVRSAFFYAMFELFNFIFTFMPSIMNEKGMYSKLYSEFRNELKYSRF